MLARWPRCPPHAVRHGAVVVPWPYGRWPPPRVLAYIRCPLLPFWSLAPPPLGVYQAVVIGKRVVCACLCVAAAFPHPPLTRQSDSTWLWGVVTTPGPFSGFLLLPACVWAAGATRHGGRNDGRARRTCPCNLIRWNLLHAAAERQRGGALCPGGCGVGTPGMGRGGRGCGPDLMLSCTNRSGGVTQKEKTANERAGDQTTRTPQAKTHPPRARTHTEQGAYLARATRWRQARRAPSKRPRTAPWDNL